MDLHHVAPGSRVDSLHWSTAAIGALSIVLPVLLFHARTRQLERIRADLAEVRSYAGEIERGLRLVSPEERARSRERRRHLWIAHGARCAVLIAAIGIGFDVAGGVPGA